ncbi:MAG TPA: biotin-independent malonate decarboxylase subunit gamma, partial [Casimicrobiaceae bacterium]|nr:biotin-independent malonate decarboxylase subunit gamma [Casimicrobiaceae bacterium]
VAVGIGDVFGGASVIACAGASLAMLPSARIGLSGPRVIETARGRGEVDASDTAAVEALFGARARAAAGDVVLVDDDAAAIRAWLAETIRDAVPFEAQILDAQARLAARSAGVVAPVPRPLLFTGRARVDAADAGRYAWRVDDALVTAPFTGRAFDGASVHALDSVLLGTVTEGLMPPIVVTEDSTGHDVSRAAEARFDSRLLAHHAAVLAYLRQRGARMTGLLCGNAQGAAFFANALQAPRLVAASSARVVAMDAAAIARVTGRDVAALIEDDPLLGHPVRHFAALGGVLRVVSAAEALDAALRE